VEECRALAVNDEGEEGEELDGLGALLAELEAGGPRSQRSSKRPGTAADILRQDGTTDEAKDEQMLGRVADFDSRLSSLETALGVSALDAASLALLDQQLAALSSATSQANFEAANARVQKLRAEADNALARPATNGHADSDDEAESTATALSANDLTQMNQLYSILPTLQSLSPTVPALLTRLRSLRTLHTTASNAASALEDVEKSQAEMDRELKAWKEGLEKVEEAVQGAKEANGWNGKVVEGWVKGLESRVSQLGR
jgi:nuclear migration protein JNM1